MRQHNLPHGDVRALRRRLQGYRDRADGSELRMSRSTTPSNARQDGRREMVGVAGPSVRVVFVAYVIAVPEAGRERLLTGQIMGPRQQGTQEAPTI